MIGDTALYWYYNGIVSIPVQYRSKVPLVKWLDYQNKMPDRKTMNEWFKEQRLNLALVCGGSKNLTVIDFDNMSQYKEWIDKSLSTPGIAHDIAKYGYRVKTSRGMHIYTYNDKPVRSYKIPGIDIQSTKRIVIAPPSIHPSGARYTPITGEILTVNIEEIFKRPEVPVSTYSGEYTSFASDFSLDSISEIKNNIDIVAFVAIMFGYSPRPTSPDGVWWMTRCAKHNDNHPSFRINRKFKRASCMKCGCDLYSDIGFDVIDIYSIMNNVDRKLAIKELSERI